MLMPRRVKYRKEQRNRVRGIACRGNEIDFGSFALQSLECAWITARQIEASRRAIARATKRGGKTWIRIFPAKPVTKKPPETRMGSGKGSPELWVAVIKRGTILFEIDGVSREVAKEAFTLAAAKLPIKTQFVEA
jgi:large subunit ribosomal protein L16